MAIAYVNHLNPGNQFNAAVSPQSTAAFDTTGANFIVAVITINTTLSSVTDNKGNGSYTLLGPYANGGGDNVYIAYKENAAVGSGHFLSITYPPGGWYATVCAAAYSGIATASALDKQSQQSGSFGTALDSGSTATTAQADELLIGGGTLSTGIAVTWTAGTNFVLRGSVGGADVGAIGFMEERIVSATGTYNATASSSQAGDWECVIATFKAAGGGGGGGAVQRKNSFMRLGVGR